MKWQKRLMSLVLAGCMSVSVLATAAMAADVPAQDGQGTTVETAVDCAAGAHAWDAGKVTVEPTETTTGIKVYTCKICGEKRCFGLTVPLAEDKPRALGEFAEHLGSEHLACRGCTLK